MEVKIRKSVKNFLKTSIITLSIASIIGVVSLELKTNSSSRVYYKVLSYCDFANQPGEVLLFGWIYNYWRYRNVQASEVADKNELVETLITARSFNDDGCDNRLKYELDELKDIGYDFKEFRAYGKWPMAMTAVLDGDFKLLAWTIELDGFVNSIVESDSSPYKGKDVYELAEAMYELEPVDSRREILGILKNYKKAQ